MSNKPHQSDPNDYRVESVSLEELQSDWEILRGAHAKPPPKAVRVSPFKGMWLELIWLARLPQRLAAAACVCAILIAGLWLWWPRYIYLRTPQSWSMAGINLPKELKIASSGTRMQLRDSDRELASRMTWERKGTTSEVNEYSLRLEWKNPAGELTVFSGSLMVTNAPGKAGELKSGSVRGASLVGQIKVGDGPWKPFSQPYTPD